MKAVRIHAHGGLEQLQWEEIAEPTGGPLDVIVQVKACALNHMDLWVRRGLPGVKVPLPLIPGCDIAGVLTAVGTNVTGWNIGDEVVVSPGISCGACESCLKGKDHLCRTYGIIGETRDGGYCERISLPVQNILRKPSNLNFEQAAAMPLVFLTAWHMLVTHGQVSPGQWVLVQAAGSGIGSAAIQIAKLFGATVIATASAEEKLQKAGEMGADYLVNYAKDNFAERVKTLTGKRGVDLVIEHVGEKVFEGSYRSLCKGGKLITCGATTGYNAAIDLRYIFFKHLQIIGSTMGSKGELLEVMRLAEKNLLRPVVDRSFPLKEAQAAQKHLESREQFGKVMVLP